MKKLALLATLAVVTIPAFVGAAPGVVTVAPAPTAVPNVPVLSAPGACDAALDVLVADIQKKSNANALWLVATIIVGDIAVATPPGQNQMANVSPGKIAGNPAFSILARSPPDPNTVGTFEITKATPGKARINWSFQGKSYVSTVDTCSNKYWTAAASGSTISIKVIGPAIVPS